MKLTDITKEQWTTYVGLLTEIQKDELVGQLYTDDSYFNFREKISQRVFKLSSFLTSQIGK